MLLQVRPDQIVLEDTDGCTHCGGGKPSRILTEEVQTMLGSGGGKEYCRDFRWEVIKCESAKARK